MTPYDPSVDWLDFQTAPARYRQWQLQLDGPLATLLLNVDENTGIRPGYQLKLNSYDLGVDIELHDALNRIRFEHPGVRCVVIASAKDKVFCSGANIFMLGQSSHAWKVNFCKFTNETRNGMEDSSQHEGIHFIAAVRGACAGGGYELALACDRILLVDDRSTNVSLPELPLLGVLPGTGGLTRLTDKRHVRHDLADIFCTTTEGVRGERALQWRLVDAIAKPAQYEAALKGQAQALVESSIKAQHPRPNNTHGVHFEPLHKTVSEHSLHYTHLAVELDRLGRTATITVLAPLAGAPQNVEALDAHWWPLSMARELDDAILHLRSNETEIGIWLFKTRGNAQQVLAHDAFMLAHQDHWLVRATQGLLRRTLARLDVSSRSLMALIEPDSCFVGSLLELALACDRSYMLAASSAAIELNAFNFGLLPIVSGQSRLQRRFHDEGPALDAARQASARTLNAEQALSLGLVTAAPDELDWADEIRLVLQERAAMSPDALSGLEANLRFGSRESMASRIFGRLSSWQNWIFLRPNASGERGALKVYGKGDKANFDRNRV